METSINTLSLHQDDATNAICGDDASDSLIEDVAA